MLMPMLEYNKPIAKIPNCKMRWMTTAKTTTTTRVTATATRKTTRKTTRSTLKAFERSCLCALIALHCLATAQAAQDNASIVSGSSAATGAAANAAVGGGVANGGSSASGSNGNAPAMLNANITDLGSPARADAALVPARSQQLYQLHNKVSLQELEHSDAASYNFRTQLKINSVWSSEEEDAQLLELFFSESQVSTDGKAEKHVERSITKLPDRPFYISLVKGQPHQLIAHTSRDQSLLNLERGIASLLQLRLDGASETEQDVSGSCKVFYHVKSSTRVEKTKADCSHWDLRVNYRAEAALGVKQQSLQHISYDLAADGALLRAESTETHRLSLGAKPDVGSLVQATLTLQHVAAGDETQFKQMEQATLQAAIDSLLEWYRVFELSADVDGALSELKEQTLSQQFAQASQALQGANVGKSSQALAFAQLLPLARISKQPEFEALFREHAQLAAQLVDLLGAVQTYDAHNATFTQLYHELNTSNEQLELLEKYLQSLTVATHPERAIIAHLFKLLHQEALSQQLQLRDSTAQTLAALVRQAGLPSTDPLPEQVRNYLLLGLTTPSACGSKVAEADCQALYIRALQNLQDPRTIEALLELAQSTEQPKVSVAALQALKSFPMLSFSNAHRQQFEIIFYQRRRRYDSSARTAALDVLLSLRPSPAQLGELLDYLASNDRQFEIKTYVLQKLRMLAGQCTRFRAIFEAALKARAHINNYHVLGQKGLTTVLTRQLSSTPAFNETLLSTQEVYQGILKRGSVEFLLHAGRAETSTFKLGIYTAGLGGIVGDADSSEDDSIPADDELLGDDTVTAGMEISVQGTQLRPLVFFNGQTELMGHVWGGSAQDSTPAYQATTLAQDHEHYIILASGATLHWRVLGARSVDLNGKVDFSLWNRNAQTEIQQNTGSAVIGHIAVGFTYAKLVHDFALTHEPKLRLQADLDFYSGIKLCMQLQRPEQILTHANNKTVYLQNVDKAYTRYMRSTCSHKSAGCTYALNQKNNEMCNMILDA